MKKIVLVGEAWGEHEARKGQPFVGPSGSLLNSFLSAVGISRSECFLTNVFNFQPPYNKILSVCGPKAQAIPGMPVFQKGKYVRAEFAPELSRLYKEIKDCNPNVIVALGSTAAWALLHNASIRKLRGSPALSVTGHKVIPTYHPAAVLREFKLRPIVFSDFKKVAAQAAFPEIVRPARELWLEPTLADLAAFEKYIYASPILSVDIETYAKQITCIGFAPSKDRAIVIPFVARGYPGNSYWPTLSDEVKAWSYVRKWLSLHKRVIGQNFLYDCRYLWQLYGTPVFHVEGDTMLLHHAMQPEMEKSLGFMGSIHTDEPSWKFMRTKGTLKKED